MKISYSISAIVRTKCRFCKQEPTYYYSALDINGNPLNTKPLPINKHSKFNPDLSSLFDPVHCHDAGWLSTSIGYSQRVGVVQHSGYKNYPVNKPRFVLTCQCGKSSWNTPGHKRYHVSDRVYDQKAKFDE